MSDQVFLLDTNIISNSSKKEPDPQIANWLRSQARVAIPFAVILEVEIGISQVFANNPSKSLALGDWFDGILKTEFDYPVPTPDVAWLLAEMYCCDELSHLWFTDPEKPKKRRPGQDLFIAATAIVYDMPIATCDAEDYLAISRRFPLPGVFDPASATWLIPRADAPPDREAWPVMVA